MDPSCPLSTGERRQFQSLVLLTIPSGILGNKKQIRTIKLAKGTTRNVFIFIISSE
jgi:hypothetical protein